MKKFGLKTRHQVWKKWTQLQHLLAAGFFAGLVCLSAACSQDRPGPPSPFIDKGVCPFECCVYREWTVQEKTNLQSSPDASADPVAIVNKGEIVQALTGQVHSLPARFELTKKHDPFQKGDILRVYTYLGEGRFKVWHEGKMREAFLGFSPYDQPVSDPCPENSNCLGELHAPLQSTWWIKIQTQDGSTGWSNKPNHFSGKDACG